MKVLQRKNLDLKPRQHASVGIQRSAICKALMISGIMMLVGITPFIIPSSEQISNAYAPGAHLGAESISESDMPTYVANASDPSSAFQYTGMALSLKYIAGSGHEVYTYFHINSSETSQISMTNVVAESSFNLPAPTNNLYWYATNTNGKDYGIVGADMQISSQDGNPTLDQYVNVNYNGPLGYPNDSVLAHCNVDGTNRYPPSVDTGGEERFGVYTVVTNPTQSFAYVITGGMILLRSNGEADMVILVNPLQTTHFDFSSFCSVPSLNFSSNEIDWTVRAPSSFNTISGNYQLYSTIGGSLEKSSGTTALICLQYIDSVSEGTQTSTTTSSSTVTSVSSTTTSNTGSSTTSSSTIVSSSSTSSSTKTTTASSTTETTTSDSSTATTDSSTTTTTDSSSTTASSTTVTSTSSTTNTTSTCTTAACENPYWNPNSQEVANYVVNNLFNSQVGLIATSSQEGCIDYVGGMPCHDTFWTTSDNVPTGWTLRDFGYPSVTQAIINECNYLKCSGPNSGDRYEAYLGWPIVVGSPGDIHGIFSPGSNTIALTCSTSGCGDGTAPYGTLSDGTSYKIQADVWSGAVGTPSPNQPIDIVGPQAINYYIRGDMTDSMKYANALVSLWNGYSVDGSGTGSVWHLGQVMFVMRALGLDTSNNTITTAYGTETYSQVFQQMENELWAIQAAYNCKGGCLPNSYTQTSPNGPITGMAGADAENQDAGLLPFSYTIISQVRSEFGAYTMSGSPAKHLQGMNAPQSKSASISPLVFLGVLSAFVSGSIGTMVSPKLGRNRGYFGARFASASSASRSDGSAARLLHLVSR